MKKSKWFAFSLVLSIFLGSCTFVNAETLGMWVFFGEATGDSNPIYHKTGPAYGEWDFMYNLTATKDPILDALIYGNFYINYPESLASPGLAMINTIFLNDSNFSSVQVTTGMGIEIAAHTPLGDIGLVNVGTWSPEPYYFFARTGERYYIGEDSWYIGPDFKHVVSIGEEVRERFWFEIQALETTLYYVRRGDGEMHFLPIRLDSFGGEDFSLLLDEPGVYDFSLDPIELAARVSLTVELNLSGYIFDQKLFRINIFPPNIDHPETYDYVIPNLTYLDGPIIGKRENVFSITVLDSTPVPEPTSLILLSTGLGVIGLGAWHRRK
jgi:hypothetical protein